MRFPLTFTLALTLALAPLAAPAQDNPFATRVMVNDRAITYYEITQRQLMLQALRAPGGSEKEVIKALVEDRLRVQQAKADGVTVTAEQIQAGMEEFAGRANLTAEQFTQAIGQGGVEPQTFRDFVEAGLLWRNVVRARFGPSAQVTEADIDRAIANATRKTEVQVLVSELIIPAPPGREGEVLGLATQLQQSISTEAQFSAAVAQYSAAPSRARGGRLDLLPLTNLPPAIAPIVLALAPGQVSDPFPIPGAVALFQLRGITETDQPGAVAVDVEYAQFLLPNDANGAAEAATIRTRVDTCNDLYTLAKGLPEDQLIRDGVKPLAEVPQDIALALAPLDHGESTDLVRGGARVLLMLCSRSPQLEEPIDRASVREQLVNQRVSGQADALLEDLRANAIIREP